MLLLYNDDATNAGKDNTNYQLYQLEMESDGTYDDSQETRFVVKAKKCSDGQLLEPESSSEAAVSGIFLASASFDFDSVKSESTRHLNGDQNDSSTAFHATVGIIRSPCEGLEAVLISSVGVHDRKEIIAGAGSSFTARPSSEVSSYWHSHTIPFDPSLTKETKRVESFFVWSIELCDGTMICWSVPYVGGSRTKVSARQVVWVQFVILFSLNRLVKLADEHCQEHRQDGSRLESDERPFDYTRQQRQKYASPITFW
jgi:hypothetical protein